MIARTTRTLFELAAASLLGVLLLAGFAAWRLAQGPVPLDFLTEHFERALNVQGAPFRISMGGTNLAWAGWQRTLDIRVVDVRATGEDGRVIARVPEMSISLSLGGLLRGVIAPRSLDLIGANVRLMRRQSGEFAFALGDSGDGISDEARTQLFAQIIDVLSSGADPERPATYLRRLSILDARLAIDDRLAGAIWGAPRADIVLLRESGEIRGTFFAEIDIGGKRTKVNGAASWRPKSDVIRVETELAGLPVDRIAVKLPALQDAAKIRLDVDGQAAFSVSIDGAIRSAKFDLKAGRGHLAIADLWPEDLPIGSVRMQGNFDGEAKRLDIEQLRADLGGPVVSGRLTAIGLGNGGAIDGNLAVDRVPLKELERYWPSVVAPLARNWVTKKMPDGIVEDVRATLSLTVPEHAGEKPKLRAMSGSLRLRETEIHYLTGMPPVRDVVASAVFTRERFVATVRSGKSEGLTVRSGIVNLSKLDTDVEHADIDVSLDGPLARALVLLDRRPLGFVSRFGLSPKAVGGTATTQLKVSLPILKDLTLDRVDIAAVSTLRDAQVPNMAFGQPLSARRLALKVDKEGLELTGDARIGEIPAAIKWVERFKGKDGYTRSYEARAVLSEEQRAKLGMPDTKPYLTGPIAVDAAIRRRAQGSQDIALKLALKDAALWLPGFNWRKAPGIEGVAWLSLLTGADGELTVRDFNIRTLRLAAAGNGRFDRDRKLAGLEITNFALDRTKFVGTVAARPLGGYRVEVNGPTFDATPFLKFDGPEDEGAAAGLPPVEVVANFDRVWLNERTSAENFVAYLVGDETGWRRADVTGKAGKNQELNVCYDDTKEKVTVSARSNDAGELLRVLGIVETMQGGRLDLLVSKPRSAGVRPWTGKLEISDFVLVRAPLLARILTSASLTGIVDTLSGKGIRFAKLDVPLEIKSGVATVKNARTVGSELGFTAEGVVDTKKETIELSGTIVPAYTLNSLLGNIPLLGDLLTGKSGSGIFAATYRVSGPLKDPKVTVNPLAALAPGFLRNLLGIFDGTTQLNAPGPGAGETAPIR